MKKKFVLSMIFAVIMALSFVTSVIATQNRHHEDYAIGHENIDELLEKLNSGYDIPVYNIQRFRINTDLNYPLEKIFAEMQLSSGYVGIDPHFYVPWTDCTNIFGHRWGTWSNWVRFGEVMHVRCGQANWACTAAIARVRTCTRTHCHGGDVEWGTLLVRC